MLRKGSYKGAAGKEDGGHGQGWPEYLEMGSKYQEMGVRVPGKGSMGMDVVGW